MNETKNNITIYWVNHDGTDEEKKTLKPNEEYEIDILNNVLPRTDFTFKKKLTI